MFRCSSRFGTFQLQQRSKQQGGQIDEAKGPDTVAEEVPALGNTGDAHQDAEHYASGQPEISLAAFFLR